MARLLNRLGRRLSLLETLHIEYPVGRSGAPFQARLPTALLQGLDTSRVRYFVIEDDEGRHYPAMIAEVRRDAVNPDWSTIRGVLVNGW